MVRDSHLSTCAHFVTLSNGPQGAMRGLGTEGLEESKYKANATHTRRETNHAHNRSYYYHV